MRNTRPYMMVTRRRMPRRCTGGSCWMLGRMCWNIWVRPRTTCRRTSSCRTSVESAARLVQVHSALIAKGWASNVSFAMLQSEVRSLLYKLRASSGSILISNKIKVLFSFKNLGASNSCMFCGHGGHIEHLAAWFAKEVVCPTGCGCHCLQENSVLFKV